MGEAVLFAWPDDTVKDDVSAERWGVVDAGGIEAAVEWRLLSSWPVVDGFGFVP